MSSDSEQSPVCLTCGHSSDDHYCYSGPCSVEVGPELGILNKALNEDDEVVSDPTAFHYSDPTKFTCKCPFGIYSLDQKPFVWKGKEYWGGIPDKIFQEYLKTVPHASTTVYRK